MAEERFYCYRPGGGLPVCWIVDRQTGRESRVFTCWQQASEACEKLNRLFRAERTDGKAAA